jgi:hypothetical protein
MEGGGSWVRAVRKREATGGSVVEEVARQEVRRRRLLERHYAARRTWYLVTLDVSGMRHGRSGRSMRCRLGWRYNEGLLVLLDQCRLGRMGRSTLVGVWCSAKARWQACAACCTARGGSPSPAACPPSE